MHALVLQRGEAARGDRRLDRRDRDAELEGVLDGPASGALLTGVIEDHVNHRFAGLRIGVLQDLSGDLAEVRFQRALVPTGEHCTDLGWRHAAHV